MTQGYFFYGNHFRGADLVQPRLFFSSTPSAGRADAVQHEPGAGLATAGGPGCALSRPAPWRGARRWRAADSFLRAGAGHRHVHDDPGLGLAVGQPAAAALLTIPVAVPFDPGAVRRLIIAPTWCPSQSAGRATAALAGAGRWRWESGWLLAVTTLGPAAARVHPAGPQRRHHRAADLDGVFLRQHRQHHRLRISAARGVAAAVYLGQPAWPAAAPNSAGRPGQRHAALAAGAAKYWTVTRGRRRSDDGHPDPLLAGLGRYVDGHSTPVRPPQGWAGSPSTCRPAAHRACSAGATPSALLADAFELLALWPAPDLLGHNAWREPPLLAQHRLPVSARLASVILAGVVGHDRRRAALARFSQPASPLPLSIDFDQLTYLHHDAIRFEDGTQLSRVSYRPTTWRAAKFLTSIHLAAGGGRPGPAEPGAGLEPARPRRRPSWRAPTRLAARRPSTLTSTPDTSDATSRPACTL